MVSPGRDDSARIPARIGPLSAEANPARQRAILGGEAMTVTYIIHKYAGTDEDRTVTVTGDLAKIVLFWAEQQVEVGITIIEVKP
jgi:hypothetical protein